MKSKLFSHRPVEQEEEEGSGAGVSKHPCLPLVAPQTDRQTVEQLVWTGVRVKGNEGTRGGGGWGGHRVHTVLAKAPYCSRTSGSLNVFTLEPTVPAAEQERRSAHKASLWRLRLGTSSGFSLSP